ncbi:MAG: hypothetical protein GYA64_04185 [Methanomicrobiales archaeon]|nr:hypothetical protein [Methanomicrobiales archaeon]
MTNRTKTPLLATLSADQAHSVLMRLVYDDPALAARAEEVARDLLEYVDSTAIADILCCELSTLKIEDVWDTSGRTRDGYIDPSDRAWEMLDEVLEYLRRGMPDESRIYALGILLGIKKFQNNSGSALLEEVPDYGDDTLELVREEWEEAVGDDEQVRLFADELREEELT